MKEILSTRLLLWKKQWLSLVCWLLLPIAITIGFLSTVETVQDDFQVPVGIVLEDDTEASHALFDEIADSPLVSATILGETEALRKVKQHELDSVFVIRTGYEEQIHIGERRDLLEAYYTNRSFAYRPVKEMIVSIIQQETGRVKAANAVIALEQQLQGTQNLTVEEVVAKSREVQQEQDLLRHSFRYQGQAQAEAGGFIQWNPWMVWAFVTLLMTIFVFDWVIKEQKASVSIRFPFMKYSFTFYMLINIAIYVAVFFIIDLATAGLFYGLYQESVSILALLTLRLMLCLFAFLLVSIIRNAYFSYIIAILWTLILVALSGAILPFGSTETAADWLPYVNPLYRFLTGELTIGWFILCLIGMIVWYIREEKKYA
ncbi:ABC transporter permease [Gracilibacillus alcaliphilus]|uniref:ABC transporter permease n=1 Tax=Gracilibacillus alcaliphilus TaxID=1401441 RepID=UPI00195EBEF6|nr:ABC transporter permease [Gracilibacillus alcaliphilus]MBM7677039.1 ABC-2 type transport system permease protein [Gracilibacillus alcaliphilus]